MGASIYVARWWCPNFSTASGSERLKRISLVSQLLAVLKLGHTGSFEDFNYRY
jgi:hypothetical protein